MGKLSSFMALQEFGLWWREGDVKISNNEGDCGFSRRDAEEILPQVRSFSVECRRSINYGHVSVNVGDETYYVCISSSGSVSRSCSIGAIREYIDTDDPKKISGFRALV